MCDLFHAYLYFKDIFCLLLCSLHTEREREIVCVCGCVWLISVLKHDWGWCLYCGSLGETISFSFHFESQLSICFSSLCSTFKWEVEKFAWLDDNLIWALPVHSSFCDLGHISSSWENELQLLWMLSVLTFVFLVDSLSCSRTTLSSANRPHVWC